MKALRAVERQRSRRLEYEDPRGNVELRRALQAHLSRTRGLACSVDQLMIVNGSQQALDLCARLLIDPGDGVVVENPGYRMAHHAFEAYGAKLLCIDVDEHGLRTDQLQSLGPAQLAYVSVGSGSATMGCRPPARCCRSPASAVGLSVPPLHSWLWTIDNVHAFALRYPES